jgi:glycogen debranching enzyme
MISQKASVAALQTRRESMSLAPNGGNERLPMSAAIVDVGREICGNLATAEPREWLCTNGIGGFASGTVAGLLTRRYHGLLVAALKPPLERTVLVAKVDDSIAYDGMTRPLFMNRWVEGTVGPHGYRDIERFRLEGTTPVWSYACADALLEKRVWMEPGANTTYIQYRLCRAGGPVLLEMKALVNYRDYHSTTRGAGWRMKVEQVQAGIRVAAFDGAQPFVLVAEGAEVQPAHDWYHGFDLAAERERGLDSREDHLHAGTFRATLRPGDALTLVVSTEASPSRDGGTAWQRRQRYEEELLARWRKGQPAADQSPAWIQHLVLAADQFVVRRSLPNDPEGRAAGQPSGPTEGRAEGLSVIAGYHWFGDWGRDTMISLPGLAISTGRPEVAGRILRTFARFVDRGMLPNRFPDAGEAPEYNTVDATLWYFEAIRAYLAATSDEALLEDLFPALEEIVRWHRQGTRYGIAVDPADGLLRSGEPGVQLTWMDAKIGDWVVTPRTGKAVEINALWYNALCAMREFARRLGRPADEWDAFASRARAGFARFWNEQAGYCFDVVDGPEGNDPALRPNQILAVSLPESPLSPERQRRVVDTCARHLLTSYGLRSLAPGHPQYQGRYGGGPRERDAAYHQGPAWGWLLGAFALAHFRVHGDPEAALAFLEPMGYHLTDYGVGSIAEIFDGDPPFTPRGCIAQAWSVSETLRAWVEVACQKSLSDPEAARVSSRGRRRVPASHRRAERA